MISIEVPPEGEVHTEVVAYIARMLQNIQNEIDGVNGVAIRRKIPEQPKEGKIYYLAEDLENGTPEGYYVFLNYVWRKMTLDPL